ncbi:MAG: SMP-30/gluconolactonase/LRE family protein, partial [Alphaproteobacteria bacterium]
MTDVACVLDARVELGECPVWCGEEGRLYWADLNGRMINRFDPATGTNATFPVADQIGSFALRQAGGLVVALRSGFHVYDLATGRLDPIADPEADKPLNRFNDGRCDPAGRFWAGTMRDPQDPALREGALYRLGVDRGVARMIDGVGTSNGLAFSPDGRTMYFADTNPNVKTIWAFDFDAETGAIANRRVFATTHGLPGRPDGACVDEEGCYWSANVYGWQVVRYAPDGRIGRT